MPRPFWGMREKHDRKATRPKGDHQHSMICARPRCLADARLVCYSRRSGAGAHQDDDGRPCAIDGGAPRMSRKPTKFVFVTGGVVSSIGKGLASASVGALLEGRGLRVTHVKLDPYINVDPGTMSPYQHGEVFVTDDGAETDLDLGHYERFT